MASNFIDQSEVLIMPPEKWQLTGEKLGKCSEMALWAKEGAQARKYLYSLGLNDDTLCKYHIGYNKKDDFVSYDDWGLPSEYNAKGNLRKVWLPRGIVVPCVVENKIRSIKILRYVTKEQKLKGEQSDCYVKGGAQGLFGADNLRDGLFVVLTDNEFDAMLLDQEAGDLVRAASFGREAKSMGAPYWTPWRHYLLPILHILIPHADKQEEIIITDSLPFYSHRAISVALPKFPSVKAITDFKKVGINPREWIAQALNSFGLSENMPNK